MFGYKWGNHRIPGWRSTLSLVLCLTLVACSPAATGTTATSISTVIPITVSAGTALVGTAEPILITPLPPDYTPPPTPLPPTLTPIPTLPVGLDPTELKYRILVQFPDLFYCDPDFYPVARADERDMARQRFPELQANPEEFQEILAHNHLSGLSTFSDDQKLLVYREHKKLAAIPFELTGAGYHFQIQVAKTEGNGELISGLIDGQGSITVLERKPSFAACPICLAAGTRIDTPSGPIPVQALAVGTTIWTVDRRGVRSAQPLIRVGKTVVPATHQVVHLVLNDGRQVWVSPGHPTADGRRMGQLQAGEELDGGCSFNHLED